jgi:hypothetical protein
MGARDVPGISSQDLFRAIRAYCELAYPAGEVPASRRHFADLADDASVEEILALKGVERLPPLAAGAPGGYALRVGAEWYAHAKIVVRALDASGDFVFGVDAHDEWIVPADPSEAEEVRRLKRRNAELVRAVERKWTEMELPTQTALLRAYLARSAPES